MGFKYPDDGSYTLQCSDSQGNLYYAEVLAFAALPLMTFSRIVEKSPRLVALVSVFDTSHVIAQCFPSFLRHEPREKRVIGVEEIRMIVGLSLVGYEDATDGRMAVVWPANARGTVRKHNIAWGKSGF